MFYIKISAHNKVYISLAQNFKVFYINQNLHLIDTVKN